MKRLDPMLEWALMTDDAYTPVAVLANDEVVESVHRGVFAVVDDRGKTLGRAGNPNEAVFMRSAAKPFQALAVIESGAADALGITTEELAVMSGSHAGKAEHVEVVERLLARLGVPVEGLYCGPSTHMCSGKHSGMIAIALHLGVPVEGYHLVDHPVQQEIARVIGGLLAAPPQKPLLAGIDGCGVPMLRLDIRQMAGLYARLAAGESEGLARIRDAMLAYPHLVAGEGRQDTLIMREAGGRVVAKVGAEGIQALGFPAAVTGESGESRAVGFVVKIADGSGRALPVLTQICLEAFGVSLPEEVFTRVRPRSPEALRGIVRGRVVSLVDTQEMRRLESLPDPETMVLREGGFSISDLDIQAGESSEVTAEVERFLEEEWPSAQEAVFGERMEWAMEWFNLVARHRGRIVAFLRGSFVGRVGTVEELLVATKQRGSGIGAMLLRRFHAEAMQRGCTRILVRTYKDSLAERFYTGFGYRRECVEAGYEFGHDYVRLSGELDTIGGGRG